VVKRPRTVSSPFEPAAGKVPRSIVEPSPRRIPLSPAGGTYNSDHPSWRISKLEIVDPFGWQAIPRGKLYEVREKLAQFESMTWNEILIESKKQHHSVEVWRLCSDARTRLAAIGLGDVETLVSLRLTAKERVWGVRQGASLLVLWWDPDHLVCPSLLKNT
jgi:hypothetical protein